MSEHQEPYFAPIAQSADLSTDAPEVTVELAKATSAPTRAKQSEVDREASDDEPEGQLTIDVYQTPTHIVVESTVAGVAPEDIDIHVTTDSITVRGSRHREKNIRDEDYLYQECYWGKFSRSIILPQEVDPEGTQATFKNGILTVKLPKLVRQKIRKVKVQSS